MTSVPDQCVILMGTRSKLGAITGPGDDPAAAAEGRPLLAYLLWHARRFGFRRVLLLAASEAGVSAERVESLRGPAGPAAADLQIEVVAEPELNGSAGALRSATPRLDERFLLLSGGSLFDANWLDLVTLGAPGVEAVMALCHASDSSHTPVVRLERDRVAGFADREDASGGLVSAGVCLLSRTAALRCPKRGSFERDMLPVLAAEGAVNGRVQEGLFIEGGGPDPRAKASAAASLRRPAIFFDRDGVLNLDRGYVHSLDRFDWMEGAVDAVKAANDGGLFAFLVTNQSGVARGYHPVAAVDALHAHMQAELRSRGAHLDDIRWCGHHPDGTVAAYTRPCDHRKPGPGMFLDLAKRWPVDLGRSLTIGDKASDLAAGRAAGVGRGALFQGGDIGAFVREQLARGAPTGASPADAAG